MGIRDTATMSVAPAKAMLGALLDSGIEADVFAWGDDKVVKFFRHKLADRHIRSRLNRWLIVNESGVPAPRCFGRVDVDGRPGIVFDRVDGVRLRSALARNPLSWFRLVREFARMQRRIHAVIEPRLPPAAKLMRRAIDHAVQLTAAQKSALLKLVDLLPGGDRLCHFDYHHNNVLVTEQGLVTIDWEAARSGNPLADVARTYLLLAVHGVPLPPLIRHVAGFSSNFFAARYLHYYFEGRAADREEMKRWLPVMAATKMREADDPKIPVLMSVVDRGLFEAGR